MDRAAISCDVLVIGAGLAGMAASLFALEKGLVTAQAGLPGETLFASSVLDLMGVSPIEEGRLWEDPFAAIAAETGANPAHPYAKVARADIEAAFASFTGFLAGAGMPYNGREGRNIDVLTPVGSRKRTYRVPESMWKCVAAMEEKAPCLIVDFEGLKGFSARQIVETQKGDWPGLRALRLAFPGMTGDLYVEKMAFALEGAASREALAEAVRPHLADAAYVAFPAILGHYRPRKVFAEMERLLGVGVFEIPTMPPGVTGLRLKAAFEEGLSGKGLISLYQKLVIGYAVQDDGSFRFSLGRAREDCVVRAKAAILATGRFFGKGLLAERELVRETTFGLPVEQPKGRAAWHRKDMFDQAGHPVNRAGLVTDVRLRPLGADGLPAFPNLYAVGSILAGQDWTRMKCGAGTALATAYAAVNDIAGRL